MTAKEYKSCDPKYYDRGLHTCGNSIKGLDKLLEKLEKEEKNED